VQHWLKYLLPLYLTVGVLLSFYAIPDKEVVINQRYSDDLRAPKTEMNGLELNLFTNEPQATIYYSLDGSLPSAKSLKYSQSVELFKSDFNTHLNKHIGSIIQKKGLLDAYPLKGYVVQAITHTNQLGFSKPQLKTVLVRNQSEHLKILSLAMDENDWFNTYSGKMSLGKPFWNQEQPLIDHAWWKWTANFQEEGESSEIPCAIEILSPEGNSLYTDYVDLRVHGNSSRGFPQKSFRIEANKYYGSGKIKNPFRNKQYEYFHSLLLRNSGNDWGLSGFADAFMQEAVSGLKVYTQQTEPVHVMLNGVYWGIYNIRSRYDREWLESASSKKSNQTIDVKKIFLEDHIDVENYMDYIIVQSYFANIDWPNNNVKTFRASKKDKWHWVLYDLDCGLSYTGRTAVNTNQFQRILDSEGVTALIFKFILEDKELKKQFKERFLKTLDEDLSIIHLNKLLEVYQERYSNDISGQMARWRKPRSISDWQETIQGFRSFILNRESVIKGQLKQL